jgi:hypothetical protein
MKFLYLLACDAVGVLVMIDRIQFSCVPKA